MGTDDIPGPSSSSTLGGLDPRMLAAATTILLAASVGTWRAVLPTLDRIRGLRQAAIDEQRDAHSSTKSAGPSDKKKRQKDRRKRAAGQRLSNQSSQTLSTTGNGPGKKFVVRQPSAQRHRTVAVERMAHESDEDEFQSPQQDTQHLTEPEQNALRLGIQVEPENIALPPSPTPGRKRSHSHRSRSPIPSPSPSASTSASTSGTPHTPSSLAVSQLSLPLMVSEWDCSWSTTTTNTKHKRRRRARSPSRLPQDADLSFPTLNPLPPPNTPLEAQVQYMRNQIENYRTREQASRAREESLSQDLDRLRMDAESSRYETANLHWQLSEMVKREERVSLILHNGLYTV